ncbi:hypothetical protein CPB85DRAFT_1301609 [Mucidula mucida]|nr:hypothetical protein CPB85DRAFT_1301609 [Mucidula mucida]
MSDHITVSDSSQWPPQVSTISQYLTNDLPPSLLSAQPTLSPRASRLWTEVTKRHPPSTSYEDLPHELLDIMDTLLSTVSIIRTLRDSNATSRETRSFVSLLLYALLRSCYPDAHVSENVRFARSYFDKLGDMTVGDATMLVSVISPLSGHLSNDAMSIDPLSTETDAVDDTDDTRSEGSRSADASVSSHSSRRSTPPNAHLYDYWHDRRSVAFPFVCVADEHSILQRITWGVQDPVIGIALSENGVSARFYFAWTDQHPHGSAMAAILILRYYLRLFFSLFALCITPLSNSAALRTAVILRGERTPNLTIRRAHQSHGKAKSRCGFIMFNQTSQPLRRNRLPDVFRTCLSPLLAQPHQTNLNVATVAVRPPDSLRTRSHQTIK